MLDTVASINGKVEELLAAKKAIQLDLGGGANPQHGFVNIDMRDLPEVDIVHDLTKFPWPLPDECAQRVMASHLLEHIPPHDFIFMNFMDEVWRVTRVGGEFMISMPYGYSPGYIQDPTHCNPCNEVTFSYFDPLALSQLWRIYKPRPWYYKYIAFDPLYNLEALLIRHSEDPDLWEAERKEWGPPVVKSGAER